MTAQLSEPLAQAGFFTQTTPKMIAGCFSLAAFGVAVVAGLASDNPVMMILVRALVSMLLCYPIGWIIGLICQRIISEHIRQHQQAHPVPDDGEASPAVDEADAALGEEIIEV